MPPEDDFRTEPRSDADAYSTPEGDAGDIEGLERRIAELQAQLIEANSRALRALADFQNFERQAARNQRLAHLDGVASLASRLVTVLDHFDLALAQDASAASAAQIMDGVKVIRDELVKSLGSSGVMIIVPQKGEPFTPGRHEAIMQQQAEGVEPGCIVATLQAGYALANATPAGGDRLLRPAKVSVAPS
jgi:molecular chaperone GrpE